MTIQIRNSDRPDETIKVNPNATAQTRASGVIDRTTKTVLSNYLPPFFSLCDRLCPEQEISFGLASTLLKAPR